MKQAMPYRAYLGWQKYWNSEPWGPWRENMHAAIIAREIRRTAGGYVPELSVWMLRDQAERTAEGSQKVMALLSSVSTKVTPKEAGEKLRAARKARKTRGSRS